MSRRASAIFAGLVLLIAVLSSCGKKKHAAVHPPSAPQNRAAQKIVSPEFGEASWYGHPYHGRPAANGEIYDMEQMTAAHRTLPFNTWVRVTCTDNSKSVDVRIIDRGPFVDGRIIDLSHVAAQAIDLIGPGVAKVRLDVLSTPPIAAPTLFGVQVGAFKDKDRADLLRTQMEAQYGSAKVVQRNDSPGYWRVVVGREPTLSSAATLAERLHSEFGPAFVVRLDEPVNRPPQ